MTEQQKWEYRMFYRDEAGEFYECFQDKSREAVNTDWLMDRLNKGSKYNFRAIVVPVEQVSYMKREVRNLAYVKIMNVVLIDKFHEYRLLSDDDLSSYKENLIKLKG